MSLDNTASAQCQDCRERNSAGGSYCPYCSALMPGLLGEGVSAAETDSEDVPGGPTPVGSSGRDGNDAHRRAVMAGFRRAAPPEDDPELLAGPPSIMRLDRADRAVGAAERDLDEASTELREAILDAMPEAFDEPGRSLADVVIAARTMGQSRSRTCRLHVPAA